MNPIIDIATKNLAKDFVKNFNGELDERCLVLKSVNMHLRHGKRWNLFEDEINLKFIHNQEITSVDIAEGISILLALFFGLVTRDQKKKNSKLTEEKLSNEIKPDIDTLRWVRNRFIHIDYEKTKVTNNGKKIEEPMEFKFVNNFLNELNILDLHARKINQKEMVGIHHATMFLRGMIYITKDTVKATAYKVNNK